MKHTILIVDDDPLILKTLKDRMVSWGTEVYSAQNSEAAIGILKTIKPEVLVLDLMLNEHDGSNDVFEFIKNNSAFSSMPILVLTNLEAPQLRETLLKQGVREYLIKGKVSLDEIEAKITSYLEPE